VLATDMPSARSVGATYVECRVIFVWMHLCESELNNKFECKNHVYTQKLQIMGLSEKHRISYGGKINSTRK